MQAPDAHVQPESEAAPCQADEQHHARRAKPGRLVEGRKDREIELRAILVPDAAVVGRLHAEAVVSGRQVRIGGLAPVDGLLPIVVVPFQAVAETHVFRIDKTQGRELDRHVADERGQAQAVGDRVGLVVGDESLDVNRRRQGIEWQVIGRYQVDVGA